MSVRPLIAALAVLIALGLCGAGAALGDGPVGRDPAANIPIGPVPGACDAQPTGADCIAGSVADLDQARADLGLEPYRVPADFAVLSPAEQALILTDLDRIAYGLAPITGLTSSLGADAARGVQGDTDPASSDPRFGYWTANWAGGYPNIVMAYDAWMYDDGPGSGNLDCTAADPKGCWGHRHDILWQFDGTDPLAMGVAAGLDPSGTPGYAMLLGEGDDTYRPGYTFTWLQAVAAGADGGSNAGGGRAPTAGPGTATPSPPAVASATPTARLRIVGVTVGSRWVTVVISAPPRARLACALTARSARGWRRDRFALCAETTRFTGVPAGRYRLRVRAAGHTVTRLVTVTHPH